MSDELQHQEDGDKDEEMPEETEETSQSIEKDILMRDIKSDYFTATHFAMAPLSNVQVKNSFRFYCYVLLTFNNNNKANKKCWQ